ncbi:MAG: S-layer homology domain-containing protein [Defluviitaleaceae bacterium]|nr:S-layer homology domain-containing protein [Defluviitaleaceae bacterium]
MKKKFKIALAMMVVAIMALGPFSVFALSFDDGDIPFTKTARFNVMEDWDAPGVEFSMISECEELIIHISDNTPVYFAGYVPLSEDDDEDGTTRNAREVLFGQTLAEMLDGRNLTVSYAITTMSIPPQTSPLSVVIQFETAVHPIGTIDPPLMGIVPPIGDLSFTDVHEDDWFYTPVMWAFANGIMNGISTTEFAPNSPMTRAMLVTVLWRYAGEPSAGQSAFADVAAGHWYTEAIAWAAANSIVLGFNETTFGPNETINREQMYTILYRYVNFAGLNIALEEEMRLQQFADANLVSDWALEALHFMFDAGIMFSESSLDNYARPQTNALRGEIAGAMYFLDMRSQ